MSFRKLLSAILVASLTLGLVGTSAFAASPQDLFNEAAKLLKAYKIVQGDPDGNLRPEADITRAEMIKIVVAAAGKAEDAKLLAGAPAFSDTQKHWVSGYAALAKNMGVTVGYPDGTFKPDAKVTYVEVVAFLARMVGLQPAKATWPMNYIQAAQEAGVIPAEIDVAKYADAPAIRGAVFVLANNAFLKVPVDGKNLYQRVFDSVPPSLTVDAVTSPTEATKVTVSGKVGTDAVALFINGQAAAFGADGAFSATVDLALGANAISVKAVDLVGNEASQKVAVERVNAPAAHIAAPASLSVAAGEAADLSVVVHDKNGVAIASPAVTATVSPEGLGTFANGKFTAGTKAQSGTLTLTSGGAAASVAVTVTPGALAKIEVSASKASAAIGEAVKFTAKGFDANGNQVTGISPVFSLDKAGAVINPATGDFIGAAAGVYTVTAKVGDVAASAKVGVFSTTASKFVVTGPANIVANSNIAASPSNKGTAATFKVQVVDENGNVIASDSRNVSFNMSSVSGFNADADNPTKVTNGVAELKAYFDWTMAGQIVTVKVTDGAGTPLQGSTTIEVVPQVASGVKLKGPSYIQANSVTTGTVTATVVDQAGVNMWNGAWQVSLGISGAGIFNDGNATNTAYYTANGGSTVNAAIATIKSIAGVAGDATVTASVANVGTASVTVKAAIATDPAALKVSASKTDVSAASTVTGGSGDYTVVTIQVVDKNGVPVTTTKTVQLVLNVAKDYTGDATDPITVYDYNLSTGTIGSAVNAQATATRVSQADRSVTFTAPALAGATQVAFAIKADKFTGAVPMTAKVSDDGLTAATTSVSFKAYKAYQVGLTRTAVTLPAANPKFTISAQLYDAAGNKVAASGYKIKFVNGDTTNVTLSASEATTDGSGIASIEATVRPYVGLSPAPTVSIDSSALGDLTQVKSGAGTVTMNIANTVANSVSVSLLYSGQTASSRYAGDTITVKVRVNDAYGVGLTGQNTSYAVGDTAYQKLLLEVVAGAINEDLTAATSVWTTGTDSTGPYYSINVTPKTAGALTFKVTAKQGPVDVASTATMGVWPTAAYALKVTQADTSTPANNVTVTEAAVSGPFTLTVVDQYGNVVAPTSAVTVTVTYPNLTSGKFASIQTSSTGGAIGNGGTLTIAAGQSTVTFYALTNQDGAQVTLTPTGLSGGAYTFTLDY